MSEIDPSGRHQPRGAAAPPAAGEAGLPKAGEGDGVFLRIRPGAVEVTRVADAKDEIFEIALRSVTRRALAQNAGASADRSPEAGARVETREHAAIELTRDQARRLLAGLAWALGQVRDPRAPLPAQAPAPQPGSPNAGSPQATQRAAAPGAAAGLPPPRFGRAITAPGMADPSAARQAGATVPGAVPGGQPPAQAGVAPPPRPHGWIPPLPTAAHAALPGFGVDPGPAATVFNDLTRPPVAAGPGLAEPGAMPAPSLAVQLAQGGSPLADGRPRLLAGGQAEDAFPSGYGQRAVRTATIAVGLLALPALAGLLAIAWLQTQDTAPEPVLAAPRTRMAAEAVLPAAATPPAREAAAAARPPGVQADGAPPSTSAGGDAGGPVKPRRPDGEPLAPRDAAAGRPGAPDPGAPPQVPAQPSDVQGHDGTRHADTQGSTVTRPDPGPSGMAVGSPPDAALGEAASTPQPRIVVRARIDTWLQVRGPRGENLIARTLRAGEEWIPPNLPGLRLTTGNAGGTEILVNGVARPPLGPVGTVKRDLLLDPARL